MSEYKAPEPEIEYVDPDLDLKTEGPIAIYKVCESCDFIMSFGGNPPADAWPDFCGACTDHTDCDCTYGDIGPNTGTKAYPTRHSWKSGVMHEWWRNDYICGSAWCMC